MKKDHYINLSRGFFAYNPEWWVWLFSITIWSFFVINGSCFHDIETSQKNNVILCLPYSSAMGETTNSSILRQLSLSESISQQILLGIGPWLLMISAMMFPLLRRSIRHVTFSVLKRDSDLGIIIFLIGYSIVWILVGLLFLALPEFIKHLPIKEFPYYVAAAILFFLSAFLSWLPYRRIIMMKCEMTIPIRLHGWKMIRDLLIYGTRIGFACLNMCWIVMLALVFTNHNLWLMLTTSLIILIERYFVPHESKLPGYFLMFSGATLLVLWTIT